MHWLKHRLTRKLLKIDRYILRGVWQALNYLSIHATYCVIVAGASPGETKMWAAVRGNGDFFTFVDHVKTNKHMFKFFSPSGSHTILVYRSSADTKHRAACLRQQSFLFLLVSKMTYNVLSGTLNTTIPYHTMMDFEKVGKMWQLGHAACCAVLMLESYLSPTRRI